MTTTYDADFDVRFAAATRPANVARMRRQYRPAAQGVNKWYRQLGGRWYMFTHVTAGWWGVGETGTVHVWRRISNGDWYIQHTYHVVG